LATFNYDTLLEEALHVVRVKTKVISDYIASDYQIIKLHGSINWGREVNNDIPDIEKLSEMQVASELIDNAAELKISDSYHITSNPPRQAPFVNRPPRLGIQKAIQPIRPPLLFPALTIPVENKSEYECPKEHSQTMERNLPRVTDLMIIGWRASEKPFLKSLGSSLERDTRILVISSSREKAIGLVGKMKDAGITGNFSTANGGFSNSTRIGGEVESFLEV